MLNVVSIYYCCCWSVVNECEKKCWKSVKFHYVFLPKEEGCSSSSSTTSLVVNFCFDDAGCFQVPVDVEFSLGLFGVGGWGMLSLLASFTGVVAVCGSSYWLLSSSATFALTTAS